MKVGDAFSSIIPGKGKEVVGLAEVVKSAYPDPTADDPQWVAVDLKPFKPPLATSGPVGCDSLRQASQPASADSPVATLGDAVDER